MFNGKDIFSLKSSNIKVVAARIICAYPCKNRLGVKREISPNGELDDLAGY